MAFGTRRQRPLSSLVKTLRNAFSVMRTSFDDKQLNLNLNPHRFRLSPHSPTCLRQRVACSAPHSSPRTTSRWTALQAKTTPRFKATVVTAGMAATAVVAVMTTRPTAGTQATAMAETAVRPATTVATLRPRSLSLRLPSRRTTPAMVTPSTFRDACSARPRTHRCALQR